MEAAGFHISRHTFDLIVAQQSREDIPPRDIVSPQVGANGRVVETQVLKTLMTISQSGVKLSTFASFFFDETGFELR
jgi:hypothetical protein